MLAFTAASSAMVPFAYGITLQRRASDGGQRIVRRTRRRFARVRAMVKRRTQPALSLFSFR
jgi:hypothetical protein